MEKILYMTKSTPTKVSTVDKYVLHVAASPMLIVEAETDPLPKRRLPRLLT